MNESITKKEAIENLERALNLLNGLSVSGRDNCFMLASSFNMLEKVGIYIQKVKEEGGEEPCTT